MDYQLLRYEATQLLLNSAALNSEHYKHQNCPQRPLELRCEQFSDSNFYHLTSAAGLDKIPCRCRKMIPYQLFRGGNFCPDFHSYLLDPENPVVFALGSAG